MESALTGVNLFMAKRAVLRANLLKSLGFLGFWVLGGGFKWKGDE